jgi:mersacidin/lichenicidin family type 2 lantibiotic
MVNQESKTMPATKNFQAARLLSVEQIVRAWQDQKYCQSLTPEQRLCLPANPAGEILEQRMEDSMVTGTLTGVSYCSGC